jgi:hypothetical protein
MPKKQFISLESFQEIIENAGYEYQDDYSGRGMYGKTCVGISTDDDLSEVIGNLFRSFSDIYFDTDGSNVDQEVYQTTFNEFCEIIKNTSSDSLGLGSIYYWRYFKTDEPKVP